MSRLRDLCHQLRIGDLEGVLGEVEYRNPEQYLTEILELALIQRHHRRTEKLIRSAGFPAVKTLADYDFDPITFPSSIDQAELLALRFIERKENVICLGSVGTGKTFLAIGLGVKACMAGLTVKFWRVADLANELLAKYESGHAAAVIKDLGKADLLILDELGYVPFSKRAAELLFTVVTNNYEQRSMIVTSNLEFGRWNEVFGDERLTAAILDRIVHHGHILAFSGKSYRFRQAMNRKQVTAQ